MSLWRSASTSDSYAKGSGFQSHFLQFFYKFCRISMESHKEKLEFKTLGEGQSASLCQSQTFRPLLSHALLNLKWSRFSSRIFYSTDVLGGWMGKAVRILIHRWLMLWVRFPVEATIFLLTLKLLDVNFVQKCKKCQICVIWEKLDKGIFKHFSQKYRCASLGLNSQHEDLLLPYILDLTYPT